MQETDLENMNDEKYYIFGSRIIKYKFNRANSKFNLNARN